MFPLCGCVRPTAAHVLSGCPVALSQDHYTYCHDQVLGCLVSGLSDLLAEVCIYAGMRASESPQVIVLILLMVTSYHPDIVIYNVTSNSVALIELTCPLDSTQHLEAARDRNYEYLQILLELDCLGVPSIYDTVELSVLGHYLPSTLTSLHKSVNFFDQRVSKSLCRKLLDKAAGRSAISASQRIFIARACMEWIHNWLMYC